MGSYKGIRFYKYQIGLYEKQWKQTASRKSEARFARLRAQMEEYGVTEDEFKGPFYDWYERETTKTPPVATSRDVPRRPEPSSASEIIVVVDDPLNTVDEVIVHEPEPVHVKEPRADDGERKKAKIKELDVTGAAAAGKGRRAMSFVSAHPKEFLIGGGLIAAFAYYKIHQFKKGRKGSSSKVSGVRYSAKNDQAAGRSRNDFTGKRRAGKPIQTYAN